MKAQFRPDSFPSFVQTLSDAVVAIDGAGDIQLWNPAAEILFGYSEQEREGLPISTLVPEPSLGWVTAVLNAPPGPDSPWPVHPIEFQARTKLGTSLSLQMSIFPIQFRMNTLVLCVFKDPHEERQRDQENKHHLISEHAKDIISFINASGVIEYVSPAVRALLGYEPAELIESTPAHLCHPDDCGALATVMGHIRQGQNIERLTYRMRHKDGHYLWLETTIQCIWDGDGHLTHLISVARDVTEQKKLSAELADVVRIAGIGHWEWDIQNDVVKWSDQMYQIMGMEPGEITLNYASMVKLVHPDGVNSMVRKVDASSQTGDIGGEIRIVRKDGSICYLHSRGEVFYDEHGKPVKMIGTSRDITERRQSEELIVRSEKLSAVGQLAAGVAHEIRNPLTALKGFTQLLHSTARNPRRKYFEIMQSELDRIDKILGELLLLAKPQAVTFRPKDMKLVIDEVITLLETQAIMTNVVIEPRLNPNQPILVNCEESQMKQVFVNVIKNAIEAMPSGGRVTIQEQFESRNVLIQFIDEGEGIPHDRIPQLGQPFFTTKEKGTGLGLMVSHKIILAHQGNMTITSEVGRGTTVGIVLPIFEEETVMVGDVGGSGDSR